MVAIVDAIGDGGGGGGCSRLLTGVGPAVNKLLRREVREISSRRPFLPTTDGGPKNVQRPTGHCPVRQMASPALPGYTLIPISFDRYV